MIKWLNELEKKQDKLKILELGCGNGEFSHFLAQRGHQVVGIDASSEGVEIAKRAFPNCQYICQSLQESLPVGMNNSFDLVMAVEVLEHLEYPRDLLRAAKKALRPNGRLILTTPYHGYIKNLVLSLIDGWDTHFSIDCDTGHLKFFSVKTLRKLLIREGFHEIIFNFAGRFPYLWKSMICVCRLR